MKTSGRRKTECRASVAARRKESIRLQSLHLQVDQALRMLSSTCPKLKEAVSSIRDGLISLYLSDSYVEAMNEYLSHPENWERSKRKTVS